jgi:Tfp pilus assembly protein PilF
MDIIAEYLRRPWVLCALALTLGFTAYIQALGYGFVYDDFPLIVDNALLRDFSNLPELLHMEDKIGDYDTGYYRPLVYFIDLLMYQAFGPRPFIFHLMSIFYHLIVVALAFLLIKRVVGSWGAAFVGSLFVALHPVNTESVTFISGKNNIQCAVLILVTLFLYLRYRDTERLKWASLSALFYMLALLTKEFALFLPFVLLAHFILTRQARRKDVLSFVISLALVAGYFALRSTVISGMGFELALPDLPLRVFNSFEVLANYMRLTVLPLGQKAVHTFRPGSLPVILSGLLATSALMIIAWRKRREEWIVLSVFWYLGFLAPVSNVIPLRGAPMAERSMYIALIGAGIAAGGLYERYLAGRRGRIVVAAALVCLAILTVMRNPLWKDNRTLYTHMMVASPESYKGFYNLGNLYFGEGENEKASQMWETALKKKPDMIAVYNNLGVAYERSGDYSKAELYYRKLLDGHSNSTVHTNLAKVLVKQGRLEEARESFDDAIEAGGDSDDLYMAYSEIYESRGDPAGAVRMLLSASQRKGGAWRLLNRAGAIEGSSGNIARAHELFSEALRLNPDCRECLFNMDLIRKLKER